MTGNTIRIEAVRQYLLELQERLCGALEAGDGQQLAQEDAWDRPGGGLGRTRVIDNGAVFEKGGVNFSHVRGQSLPPSASASRPERAGRSFQAMGVSVVMHPVNTHVTTSHANVSLFVVEIFEADTVWLFGA